MLATINRGGIQGGGAASSNEVTQEAILVPISGPVNNTRSDTCWFAVTEIDKYGYVTNFQSSDDRYAWHHSWPYRRGPVPS